MRAAFTLAPALRLAAGAGGVIWLALAAAGCDWRKFDDLREKTPVIAVSAPSSYAAGDDFGSIVLPVAPPIDGSAAGRFIVSAARKTSLAVVSLSAAGLPSSEGLASTALDLLQGWPITAVAAVPGGRNVLLGSPGADLGGTVMVMSLNQADGYTTNTFLSTTEGQYGVGLAAANVAGGAAPDFIVLSATTLHVYLDGEPTADQTYPTQGAADPCPIDFSGNLLEQDKLNRAVVIAPLMGGGTQIAVGTPSAAGPGHVSIFNVDATTGKPTCATALMATEPRFGRALALVDLDGVNGVDHLLVGAPPTHVYAYSIPVSAGQTPVPATDASGTTFGTALAAMDIDNVAGEEVFIGSPEGMAGSTSDAGNVTKYLSAALTKGASSPAYPNPLTEKEPASGHGYGAAVAGVTFCPANVGSPVKDGGVSDAGAGAADGGIAPCTVLPIVGSLANVYVYYTQNAKIGDPRLK